MSYAKTGIWGNWLFEKKSILILISQYSLRFHLDYSSALKKNQRKGRKNQNVPFSWMVRPHRIKMQMVHELRYMWNPIPCKVPNEIFFFFLKLNSMILKFIWKMSRSSQFCFKPSNCRRFVLPDNKMLNFIYKNAWIYKDTVIITVIIIEPTEQNNNQIVCCICKKVSMW